MSNSQNIDIVKYLSNGGTLTCLDCYDKIKVGYLNSRISDLRNQMGLSVSSVLVKVMGSRGRMLTVNKYYATPQEQKGMKTYLTKLKKAA